MNNLCELLPTQMEKAYTMEQLGGKEITETSWDLSHIWAFSPDTWTTEPEERPWGNSPGGFCTWCTSAGILSSTHSASFFRMMFNLSPQKNLWDLLTGSNPVLYNLSHHHVPFQHLTHCNLTSITVILCLSPLLNITGGVIPTFARHDSTNAYQSV